MYSGRVALAAWQPMIQNRILNYNLNEKLMLTVTFLFIMYHCFSQMETISLNGTWSIDESIDSLAIPTSFNHKVDVPGLVRTAEPHLEKVDLFTSADYNFYWDNPERLKLKIDDNKTGMALQNRNYFWYKRSFRIKEKKELAVLKVNKAQFGSAVWINGKLAGQNLSNCTSGHYNITNLVNYNSENEIFVRIGAHPGVLPKWIFSGKYSDKRDWTPGIWDDVSIISCNNTYIETIQVAPDINRSEITFQAKVINFRSNEPFNLGYVIKEWKTGKIISSSVIENIRPSTEGKIVVTEKIPVSIFGRLKILSCIH